MWEWYPLQLINAETGNFAVPAFLDLEFSDGCFWLGYGTSAAIAFDGTWKLNDIAEVK